jgi:hypothetical protein
LPLAVVVERGWAAVSVPSTLYRRAKHTV